MCKIILSKKEYSYKFYKRFKKKKIETVNFNVMILSYFNQLMLTKSDKVLSEFNNWKDAENAHNQSVFYNIFKYECYFWKFSVSIL